MPVNIKLNQNEAMSSAYGKYYLEVATSEVLSTEGLVNHITHHNCAVGTEKNGLLKSQLLDSKVNPLDVLAGVHLRFRPQSDDLNDLTSKSFLKMQVQPVINLVCRAKAVDLTPEITDKTKKKWLSQKCTLSEFRSAGGFPTIDGSSSGSNTGGGNSGGPSTEG